VDIYRGHRDAIARVVVDSARPSLGGAETLNALREVNPDVRGFLRTRGADVSGVVDRLETARDDLITPCRPGPAAIQAFAGSRSGPRCPGD
jgi:hypothetical protein